MLQLGMDQKIGLKAVRTDLGEAQALSMLT
jgi:hypothetical protein